MTDDPGEKQQPTPSQLVLPSPASRRLDFQVNVRWLFLGATLIAFGPIAALAVVASLKDAEALSTVALALAIVAFAIQVLVFIVQTQTATQHALQSERLNMQTRELLVEIGAAAKSTQTMVGEQFRDLLRAFLEGASKTAAETGKFDPEQFEQRLMNNIRQATQRPPQSDTPGGESPAELRRRLAAIQARTAAQKRRPLLELTEFPPENEGRPIAERIRELSELARRRLQQFAEDEINSRESGVYTGLTEKNTADKELLDKELITPARVTTESGLLEVKRLTDLGRKWARLLVARGDIPKYAADLIPPLPQDEDNDDDDIPF